MTKKTLVSMLLGTCLLVWSCETNTKNVDSCGDGFVDPGEECDTTVGEHTCQSLGYYNPLGVLRCTIDCQLDDGSCGGRCGDEEVQGTEGEECDGGDLNGQNCQSLGYTGGTLACGAGCTYDVSGCAGKCGNGVIDADEGEICDGGALAGETCKTQGYHGGELMCMADCSGYNLDNCTAVGRCGDGVIQGTYGEICDGANLDEKTCEGEGYYGGQLTCSEDCEALELTDCESVGACGDGIIQSEHGEDCDGFDLDGQTCVSLNYSARGGTLTCGDGCVFDMGACIDKSDNADLASLTLSAGTLTPAFSADTTAYSVTVPLAVTTLTVTGTAADAPHATVEVSPAQPVDLVEGENPVTVTVSAEDGSRQEYLVKIMRAMESPNIGTMIHVPSGTFQRDATATNLSEVSSFRMSKYEITRAQWVAVTGWADPSYLPYSSGTNDPVQMVSWYDAIAFCNKLSLAEGLTPVFAVSGVDFSTLTYVQIPTTDHASWNAVTADWEADGYRLPTEMEWMWAAMGADMDDPGVTNTSGYAKAFAGSDGSNAIGDYAVFGFFTDEEGRTTTERTNPVGSKLPNELGLHDLSGNVFEWAWDWYSNQYPTGTLTDYRGPGWSQYRGKRGGFFANYASECTVANRGGTEPRHRSDNTGFRVVRR